MKDKIPLIAVIGPTASGKTALSVRLAQAFDGEVVGADSMQIYDAMQIATARPTPSEMQGVPHHLIGFLPAGEAFSVAQYTALAGRTVREIHERGRLPILCGGTGLFVDSLLENIQFAPQKTDPAYRAELQKRCAAQGAETLLEELRSVDPESAARLHPNNLGRIIRAMEVYRVTGQTLSYWNARSKTEPSPYDAIILAIGFRNRELLYERINRRVDQMMEQGLLEETRRVLSMGELPTARQAIGCKELAPYLRGECTLEAAVERLKQGTRRYAKRQMTWFRRNEKAHWFYVDDYGSGEELFRAACEYVKGVGGA